MTLYKTFFVNEKMQNWSHKLFIYEMWWDLWLFMLTHNLNFFLPPFFLGGGESQCVIISALDKIITLYIRITTIVSIFEQKRWKGSKRESSLAETRVILHWQRNRKWHTKYFHFNSKACRFHPLSRKISFKST